MLTFSGILLCLSLLLLAVIAIYASFFTFVTFFTLFLKKSISYGEFKECNDTVAVCIPVHNEEIGLVHNLNSLLEQQYSGMIRVVLLLADQFDSSVPFLQDKFKFSLSENTDRHNIFVDSNFSIEILFTHQSAKREKLNQALDFLQNKEINYVAFLDADHRVSENWVKESVCFLQNSDCSVVQTRRKPLALNKLSQVVDAAQNHVGNEILNIFFKRYKLQTFFTGTACLFDQSVFRQVRFRDCLTEDTFLSYELSLIHKVKIGYLETSSSQEELAPDIYSYFARRRRWSNGHNQVFFNFFGSIFKSNLSVAEKFKFMVHGMFFLVPTLIILLLNVYGIHLFLQFSTGIKVINVFLALLFSEVCLRKLCKGFTGYKADAVATFLCTFPVCTTLIPYLLEYTDNSFYYLLVSFPYAEDLTFIHFVCVLAPLVILVIGNLKLRILNIVDLFKIVLSYPFFLFIDLYSGFLGFFDFLFKKRHWPNISRNYEVTFHDKEYSRQGVLSLLKLIPVIIILCLVNDFTAYSNCGKYETYLWPAIFYKKKDLLTLDIHHSSVANGDDLTKHKFMYSFIPKLAEDIQIEHSINNHKLDPIKIEKGLSFYEYTKMLPRSWNSYSYKSNIQYTDLVCRRNIKFHGRTQTIIQNKLYVNERPFLIKGMIPSHSTSLISNIKAFEQIQKLGVNTIRLYHEPTEDQMHSIKKLGLMLISQPNRSTWTNLDLRHESDANILRKNFNKFYFQHRGDANILLFNSGNELALKNIDKVGPKLMGAISEFQTIVTRPYLTYSTFFEYIRFPVDILGVNMLDTGQVYWNSGLKLLKDTSGPFYASEFGGFAAFYEFTPEPLRAARLYLNWQKLQKNQSSGAVLFESHDNWAQPVPSGFNDPFSQEQADDFRGFWDYKNNPKDILQVAKFIFSDLKINDIAYDPLANIFNLKIINQRDYPLQVIHYQLNEAPVQSLGNLSLLPQESFSINIPVKSWRNNLSFLVKSHQGIKTYANLQILLPNKNHMGMLNQAFYLSSENKGLLIEDEHLELIKIKNSKIVKESVRISPAFERAIDVQYKIGERPFRQFKENQLRKGEYMLTFRLPRTFSREDYLLLDGLGAKRLDLKIGNFKRRYKTHYYREVFIPISDFYHELRRNEMHQIELTFSANAQIYISKESAHNNKEIRITLAWPRLFRVSNFSKEMFLNKEN